MGLDLNVISPGSLPRERELDSRADDVLLLLKKQGDELFEGLH
jgi:hypothetical protein